MPRITPEQRLLFIKLIPKAEDQLHGYVSFADNAVDLYGTALCRVEGREDEMLGRNHKSVIDGLEEARRDSLVMLSVLFHIKQKRSKKRRFDRYMRRYYELFNIYQKKTKVVDRHLSQLIDKLGDLEEKGIFDEVD